MVRPLRLEFSGALYHVTSRGDHSEAIYRDHQDRVAWLETMQVICKRFNFLIHGYCQMTNHYHLLLETVEGNLAQGMRQLNGLYTQRFNRRHCLVGHLFQGRYKAILVQKESHLLALARYVILNPVRAAMVQTPEEWLWSSHLALLGCSPTPEWLETDWLLAQFGAVRAEAVSAYAQFVAEGRGLNSPLKDTSHQLILGDEAFVGRHQKLADTDPLKDVSRAQRRAFALSLAEYQARYPDIKEAMARAYHSTAFTMEQIGVHFSVSARTVSRAIQKYEN